MQAISEKRCTNVPFEHASPYLEQYIRDVVSDGGGRILLSVAIPIERFGIDRRIELSRMVSVRFSPVEGGKSATRLTGIWWEPDKGGPYPQFSGTIGIAPNEQPDRCAIVLEGEYDPPFGIVGDAFDSIIGKHIARTTVRNLLDEIAIIMETSYASSTAAEPLSVPK